MSTARINLTGRNADEVVAAASAAGYRDETAYLEAIEAAVRGVANRPEDGRPIDDRLPDLRRVTHTLTVVAVLHVRMDLVRHLG